MAADFETLRDWAINNVKNKDLINGKLKNIINDKNGFLAEYTDKSEQFIIKPYIDGIDDLKNNGFVTIGTL